MTEIAMGTRWATCSALRRNGMKLHLFAFDHLEIPSNKTGLMDCDVTKEISDAFYN